MDYHLYFFHLFPIFFLSSISSSKNALHPSIHDWLFFTSRHLMHAKHSCLQSRHNLPIFSDSTTWRCQLGRGLHHKVAACWTHSDCCTRSSNLLPSHLGYWSSERERTAATLPLAAAWHCFYIFDDVISAGVFGLVVLGLCGQQVVQYTIACQHRPSTSTFLYEFATMSVMTRLSSWQTCTTHSPSARRKLVGRLPRSLA